MEPPSSEPAAAALPDDGARSPLGAEPSTPGPEAPGGATSPELTVPVVTATLAPSVRAAEPPAPVRLEYAAIGAVLPVVPTGVTDEGQMEIPQDAATAGWYRFGPAPADGEGNTVIAAHAGSVQTPEGPLYGLRQARPGDVVSVEDASGRHHAYRVTAVERLGKDGLDFTPYFARSGPERLVLVTCGGQWLPERQSYADNIIVVAEAGD
jgi:Sortase domain